MRPLDWLVLSSSVAAIAAYGVWKGRGSDSVKKYLLAEKSMPWYAMALSIMATQASAITFISTTGQSYVDGMRFVQFYFGLPLAMIILSATAVPIFHRANVYTAYEYLEHRFDARVRALMSLVFLIQRGLAVGVALSAPSLVLTVILGWPDAWTSIVMGLTVIFYTVLGGIKAVTWTDFQQMIVMMAGLFLALFMAVWLLPPHVGLGDAVAIAGAAGRLNPVTTTLNWSDRYNLWSGLLGGMFLALAYFGCDQSQVQRYLTGKSIAQSRLSLLFNAVAKIPMQFVILFTGAMVLVFYVFVTPPVLFHQQELQRVSRQPEYGAVEQRFLAAHAARKQAALSMVEARHAGDQAGFNRSVEQYRAAQQEFDAAHKQGQQIAARVTGNSFSDANYIFLSFVTGHLPAGLVGLIIAAILAAAMSTISAEINSLATVSVVDVYRRFLTRQATDRHYLNASRLATAFWGVYAMITAQYAKGLGSLIEVVNLVGSLFYPCMLGVFVLAFYFRRVGATAAFWAVLIGEAVVFTAHLTGAVSFLWYNVVGCVVVIVAGLAISAAADSGRVPADR